MNDERPWPFANLASNDEHPWTVYEPSSSSTNQRPAVLRTTLESRSITPCYRPPHTHLDCVSVRGSFPRYSFKLMLVTPTYGAMTDFIDSGLGIVIRSGGIGIAPPVVPSRSRKPSLKDVVDWVTDNVDTPISCWSNESSDLE